jgi:DNA-nicking Smr family endonuclease
MKRPSPHPMAGHSPPRGRRNLSEEERALWEGVARQVEPLQKKNRIAQHATSLVSETPKAKPAASPRPLPAVNLSKPAEPAAPPLMPLGRRERARLSRGRSGIDARLDLHGMTQLRAHRALIGFLQRAHREGLTFVLIITGKGNADSMESERGVLRRQVPQWLSMPEFRSLVVGFEEAHVGHGGEGALYVRVRRSRT